MFDLKSQLNSLPLRISLYVGLPTLALFIYILKKAKTEPQEEEDLYDNEDTYRYRSSVLEVKVPNDCVRLLIGPQGSRIKEFQRSTDTRINFKDKNLNIETDKSDKIVVIRGLNVNVAKAEMEIKRFIFEMPTTRTEEYFIPENICGKIIGRGGANIRDMTKKSNCKIKLNDKGTNDPSKETDEKNVKNIIEAESNDDWTFKKIVKLTGTEDEINAAKNLIIAKINEERKIKNNKLNQKKFDSYLSRDYTYGYKANPTSFSSSSSLSEFDFMEPSPLGMPRIVNLDLHMNFDNEVDIFVSAVAHPFAFWVQIVHEDSFKLEDLIKDMNEHYCEKFKDNFECIEDVQIGTLVAGYFNNSSWHRAEVKGFKSVQQYPTDPTDPLVDVFFVDFGDSDYLKLSELRKLPQRFHELPLQAIECSLDDLALNENETSWSDDAVDYFEEISYSCQWKALELKLIKYSTDVNSNHLKPSVVLTDKKKKETISEMLVKKGYGRILADSVNAENKDENHQPESSEQLTNEADNCC